MRAQYGAAKKFVSELNEALINEQCSMSTVLESRFAARDGELVLEIFCVRSAQLSIFMDSADIGRDADPNELLIRARGRWAEALKEALIEEETIRQELAGLATAATRLKVDEEGAPLPLLSPNELEPALNRQVPEDAVHATQGSNEFDLNGDVEDSPPVWETACTVRAQPRLARNAVDFRLLAAPSGHHIKMARASIEDISEADFKIIAVAAKRKVGICLDVQLATSHGHSRRAICKVLSIGKDELALSGKPAKSL